MIDLLIKKWWVSWKEILWWLNRNSIPIGVKVTLLWFVNSNNKEGVHFVLIGFYRAHFRKVRGQVTSSKKARTGNITKPLIRPPMTVNREKVKVVLIGELGAGKTSIFLRFAVRSISNILVEMGFNCSVGGYFLRLEYSVCTGPSKSPRISHRGRQA
jgi:hypothetical protein